MNESCGVKSKIIKYDRDYKDRRIPNNDWKNVKWKLNINITKIICIVEEELKFEYMVAGKKLELGKLFKYVESIIFSNRSFI